MSGIPVAPAFKSLRRFLAVYIPTRIILYNQLFVGCSSQCQIVNSVRVAITAGRADLSVWSRLRNASRKNTSEKIKVWL